MGQQWQELPDGQHRWGSERWAQGRTQPASCYLCWDPGHPHFFVLCSAFRSTWPRQPQRVLNWHGFHSPPRPNLSVPITILTPALFHPFFPSPSSPPSTLAGIPTSAGINNADVSVLLHFTALLQQHTLVECTLLLAHWLNRIGLYNWISLYNSFSSKYAQAWALSWPHLRKHWA